jgi:hypothetical protein
MLLVSGTDYDDVEMEELITERCSEFGLVTDIEIRREADPYCYDFAIVEMSTEEEASEVVNKLGGKEYGSSVVMKILHEGKLIPGPRTLH